MSDITTQGAEFGDTNNTLWLKIAEALQSPLRPANTVIPTITPTSAAVGDLLTAHSGTWTGDNLSFSYQWNRDGVVIGGATATTYTTVSADGGKSVTVTETATNAFGSASATSLGVAVSAYDPDASAFFVAADANSWAGDVPLQKSAVNQLVLDLKSASLWTKLELIYPFVGGNATPHRYNLKNPAAFQITWGGTVTHDANGVTGNGSTGWGDTGWATASASIATLDSVHLYCYCRSTTPTDQGRLASVSNTTGTSRLGIARNSNTIATDGPPHAGGSITSPGITNSNDMRGSCCLTRTASNLSTIYQRALTPATAATASVLTCTGTLGLLARNFESFGPDNFSDGNLAMFTAGGGLTQSDYDALKAADLTFQTALGRNV